ncbi:MAG: cupin domain-containing protein [Planctomycetes bacterium]|nr:cupin domain-containing protein [Planctomycetota bacterium]
MPVKTLDELSLEALQAHDGRGLIGFHRLFERHDFAAPCNFVDYAVLPPGASIGRHRHGDDEEIYLVLAGSGAMHRDGETFRVGPGSVIVNARHGEHGLENDGDDDLRLFVIEIAAATTGDDS